MLFSFRSSFWKGGFFVKKTYLCMKVRIFSLLWVKDKGKGEKPFIFIPLSRGK